MTRLREALTVVIVTTGVSVVVADEPFSIRVVPAFAPNGLSRETDQVSPSWDAYVENAIMALQTEADSIGDRSVSPDAYEVAAGSIPLTEMIHTEFPSWQASANPSATWASLPDAFKGELGNRIHFGTHIKAVEAGRTLALGELFWELDSDDETNFFDQKGSFVTASYSPTRVGINYGPDGQPGGGDDRIYKNGETGVIRVHELLYVGVGEGFFSQEPNPASDQDDINETLRSLLQSCDEEECTFSLSSSYTVAKVTGTGSIDVLIEPGLGGDHNRDGILDCDDLNLMTTAISSGSNDILFDMNLDGVLNFDDLEIAVHDKHNTFFGDANCDGEFSSSDLLTVFVAGLYETDQFAVWTQGDWNGDGVFGSSDLVVALVDGGYEQGPVTTVVPEPTGLLTFTLGLFGLAAMRRRRRK